MTLIAYLDEQHETINDEDFTAIVGFVLPAAQLDKLRQRFYPEFNRLLTSGKFKPQPVENTIHWIAPVLHGSSFFKDQDDDFKFAVLDILFEALEHVDAQFIRIGSFHTSLPIGDKSAIKKQAIEIGMTNVLFALSAQDLAFQIVFELDKEDLKRQIKTTSDGMCGFYCMGEANTEVAFRRFIGHFFAPKADFGCQIADVVGYVALKDLTARSEFGRRFGRYSERVTNRYILNEITWFNCSEKSLSFPQQYEKPLSRWFPITPSD